MCGRITLYSSHPEIEERYKVQEIIHDPMQRYNIAPGSRVAVVLQNGSRALDSFKWGLVPIYSKSPYPLRGKKEWCNAKSENMMSSSLYKRLLSRRRCIVPVNGFYEWIPVSKTNKLPYFIHSKTDNISSFAALWDTWEHDGDILKSCAVITTTANATMAPIHTRMPVFLPRELEEAWLDPTMTDLEELRAMLKPCDPDIIEACRVSKNVNNARYEAPDCITPLDETTDSN